jgi:hypothetical protein
MLLNGQRLFYCVALIATFSLVGCVDIPANGPTPPNYRSSVKFFHAGSTIDTIAYPISKITYTRRDSVQNTKHIVGTDSLRTKILYEQTITVVRYRRYRVDYAQPYDLYIDGASTSTALARGAATNYFDVASGSRLFTVKGNGTSIDSITIVKIDTLVTTYRDSIKGNSVTARLVSDTTRDGKTVKFIPVAAVTSKMTIDSITTTIETERQSSMYLIGRSVALEQNESGLARFGKIAFLNTAERFTYQTSGRTDSAIVKFVNAYPDTGIAIRTSSLASAPVRFTGLAYGSARTMIFPAKNDTTYKFYVWGSAALLDSVSVAVSKTKSYSVVILNNAGVRSTQAYTH